MARRLGVDGDCWMPEYLVPHLSGAWKAVDAIEHPMAWAHTVDVVARPSLNVRREPTTAKAAAHRLGLSQSTVKHHLANALTKVGATTTAQLVWILAPRLPQPEGRARAED